MPLPQLKTYTIDDIFSLPDGERAELIDGQIYNMAPPSATHQRIVQFLSKTIGNYIDIKQGGCEVFPAPFAVFLDKENKNYVEPDVSVICDKNKIDEKGCYGAPDWIIEVVSLSSKTVDYYKKLALYREYSVREYWIIDSSKKVVMVYNLELEEIPAIYHFMDKVKVYIYGDLEIDFSQMKL